MFHTKSDRIRRTGVHAIFCADCDHNGTSTRAASPTGSPIMTWHGPRDRGGPVFCFWRFSDLTGHIDDVCS
jgi:hypothetical protein